MNQTSFSFNADETNSILNILNPTCIWRTKYGDWKKQNNRINVAVLKPSSVNRGFDVKLACLEIVETLKRYGWVIILVDDISRD